ncbi:hypothetical protein F5Y14DRAFT_300490 [Nemania sp. NC0429]|nr:hypothetical protein F5Y14DRAFT_300490 [Nemania sp. NC0429]
MPISWNLDVSAFLVLLSKNQEVAFRRANKRLSDVLSLAPVSGLQGYLQSYMSVVDVQDREYISPYGRKRAPLRDMRLAQMIARTGVLDDGHVTTYQIDNDAQPSAQSRRMVVRCWLVTITSWILFSALILIAFQASSITWVGKSNLLALGIWSVFLRVLDAVSLTPSESKPLFPDRPDAVIFLGRRNSAFILEGTREDVLQWTGLGLRYRTAWGLKYLHIISRIGTLLLLAFMFLTIPSGSSDDRALFFSYNVLGQLNTWLGLHMHTRRTFLELEPLSKIPVATRTHVYAVLLRRFQEEKGWTEYVNILPRTPVWNEWRRQVVEVDEDAKVLWERIADSM